MIELSYKHEEVKITFELSEELDYHKLAQEFERFIKSMGYYPRGTLEWVEGETE